MEHDHDADDGDRPPDRAAGSPPRGAWLFDPGWLFVLAGVALCAAWLILPAERELIDLRNQRRALEAEHVRMLGALRAHADFLEEFERREPALIEHLAAAQLNLVPAGHQPGLLATRTDASPSARIAESMAARYTAPAPERPINSRLEHLVLGPARLWVVAAAILSIFMGLILGPGIPTTTPAAAGDDAEEGKGYAAYDGDLAWEEEEDDDDDDDREDGRAGVSAGRDAELGRWRSRWATAREAAAAAIAAHRAGERHDVPSVDRSAIDPASATTTGAGGTVDGEPMVSVVSGHEGWTALFDLGTTAAAGEGTGGRSTDAAPVPRASRRGGAAGHDAGAMLWDAVTTPPRDPDAAADHRTGAAAVDTDDDEDVDEDVSVDEDDDADEGDEDEYEYVSVDEDGNEIPADEADDAADEDDEDDEDDDEYEYVYVDEDGNEIPADEAEEGDEDLDEDEDDGDDGEYEYVYVDEDGNEIPADEVEDGDEDLEVDEVDASAAAPADEACRGAGKSPRHRR